VKAQQSEPALLYQVFGEAGYLGLDEAVKSQLKDKFDDMEVNYSYMDYSYHNRIVLVGYDFSSFSSCEKLPKLAMALQ
jgi:hypothetical protein